MYYCNVNKEPEQLNYKDVTRLIKVCHGYDDLSKVYYKTLINESKDLDFYQHIKHYQPKEQGSIIRWLYRGLSLRQALLKTENQINIVSNIMYSKGGRVIPQSPYIDRFQNLKDGNVIDSK